MHPSEGKRSEQMFYSILKWKLNLASTKASYSVCLTEYWNSEMCFGRLMLSRIACARVTRGRRDNYSWKNKSVQLQIMSLPILNYVQKISDVCPQKQIRKKVQDAAYTREV